MYDFDLEFSRKGESQVQEQQLRELNINHLEKVRWINFYHSTAHNTGFSLWDKENRALFESNFKMGERNYSSEKIYLEDGQEIVSVKSRIYKTEKSDHFNV